MEFEQFELELKIAKETNGCERNSCILWYSFLAANQIDSIRFRRQLSH